MKNRLINGFSAFEVLDDDALEQRRCHLCVPDATGVHNNDGTITAYTKAWRFTTLDACRTEKQVFALEELGEQRIKLSPTAIGRAEFASAYEHVTRVRLHLRLLSLAHSKKIHGINPAHTCTARSWA